VKTSIFASKAKNRLKWRLSRSGEARARKALAAFAEYRDMGAGRSIPKVYQKCTENQSLLKRWSARWSGKTVAPQGLGAAWLCYMGVTQK
jgi:hypothetical protein